MSQTDRQEPSASPRNEDTPQSLAEMDDVEGESATPRTQTSSVVDLVIKPMEEGEAAFEVTSCRARAASCEYRLGY